MFPSDTPPHFTPDEYARRLDAARAAVADAGLDGPTLVLIGEVLALAEAPSLPEAERDAA